MTCNCARGPILGTGLVQFRLGLHGWEPSLPALVGELQAPLAYALHHWLVQVATAGLSRRVCR